MARLIVYKNKKCDVSFVTACIIKFCEHEPNQAEQCATIINSTGQYDVKHGDYHQIEEMSYLFENVGLETKIVE
jgi:ATP-dependent Clp protease adaptor protein ClpS